MVLTRDLLLAEHYSLLVLYLFQGEVEIDDDDLSTFEVRTVVFPELPLPLLQNNLCP